MTFKTPAGFYADLNQNHFVVVEGSNVTMKPYERVAIIRATTSVTITLPKVSEFMGDFVDLEVVSIAAGATVTVQDAGDDSNFTNLALTAAGDYGLIFSNGLKLRTVHSQET